MQITVNITQKEIDQKGCPIERAIEEQTEYGAHVGERKITLWSNSKEPVTVPITYKRALEFIHRRDIGKRVQPFIFKLDIP